ncbi:hypothetical protein PYW08_000647 [Mythimna loreyi]|uniref:Uncharacterized protein n=1 Tax=Mythimna loreyi TaxID=667449 RepID=A0ACC2RD46_9NEOP|nr:hypothetical protein PYW08_000647 [Mythimna loreyi]
MFVLFRITCSMLIISSSHSKSVVFPAQFQDTQLRVLGGRDMRPDEYSAVVVFIDFELGSVRICTGVMMTDYWGLTAAHCTIFDNTLHVWYKNFTEQPIRLETAVEILETFIHPSFRMTTYKNRAIKMENDICLFHSFKVNVKGFARLSAVDYTTMLGLPIAYVGGGSTSVNTVLYNNISAEDNVRQLQVGEGLITRCGPYLRMMSKYIICISPKCANRGETPWPGDSGGPLIHDNRVIGVASLILPNVTIGFTPVSPYLDWIYQITHSRDNF